MPIACVSRQKTSLPPRAAPGQQHAASRPVLVHDGGDDICQPLMPRLDPRTFVKQQSLSVRAILADEKHAQQLLHFF
jgi:hypothetical protein